MGIEDTGVDILDSDKEAFETARDMAYRLAMYRAAAEAQTKDQAAHIREAALREAQRVFEKEVFEESAKVQARYDSMFHNLKAVKTEREDLDD